MARSRKSPRYFDDSAAQFRRFLLGAGTLSAFVLIYTLGTAIGLLHP